MQNKSQNILITIIIGLIIIGGFLLYQQQRSIADLEKQILGGTASVSSEPMIFNEAEKIKKELKDETSIRGIIKQILDGMLIVEAEIVDLSKLDNLDYSESVELPALQKSYGVELDEDTVFIEGQLSDLKAGDFVFILSNKSIYDTDELTAVEVYLLSE